MRPLEYLNDWTARDRGLAEALLQYEDGLHSCGHPLSRSAHPDMDGYYEVDTEVVCYACAAQASWEKDNKPDDRPPGQVVRVLDTRPPEKPLPPLRPDVPAAMTFDFD